MKEYSGDQTKKTELGRACRTHGGEERCLQGFGGKILGKKQLGRPKGRRDNNIKPHLRAGKLGHDRNDVAQGTDQRWLL